MARRQPLVVEPEQLQSALDVLLTPDRVAHPPGLRQDVMQLRLPFGHELLPHPYRKGKSANRLTWRCPISCPFTRNSTPLNLCAFASTPGQPLTSRPMSSAMLISLPSAAFS